MSNGWSAVACIVSGIAAACGLYSVHEVRKANKERASMESMLQNKIDTSIDEISKMDTIDINEKIIEAGVNKASEKVVREYADTGARDIRKEVVNNMRKEADDAIDDLKEDFRPEVKKTLEEKVKKVIINDIKKEVIGDISDDLKKKMDKEVADLVKKQNDRLDELSKIYDNINAALKAKEE